MRAKKVGGMEGGVVEGVASHEDALVLRTALAKCAGLKRVEGRLSAAVAGGVMVDDSRVGIHVEAELCGCVDGLRSRQAVEAVDDEDVFTSSRSGVDAEFLAGQTLATVVDGSDTEAHQLPTLSRQA